MVPCVALEGGKDEILWPDVLGRYQITVRYTPDGENRASFTRDIVRKRISNHVNRAIVSLGMSSIQSPSLSSRGLYISPGLTACSFLHVHPYAYLGLGYVYSYDRCEGDYWGHWEHLEYRQLGSYGRHLL